MDHFHNQLINMMNFDIDSVTIVFIILLKAKKKKMEMWDSHAS